MIDFNFIRELEGFSLKGYVPSPDVSNSGVTVATGFDLGGWDEGNLDMYLSEGLASKLMPYARLKKFEAFWVLHNNPLGITMEEAYELDKLSSEFVYNRIKYMWPGYGVVGFDKLSDEVQTIVASVAYQYGNIGTRTPNFWMQVTSGDWEAALANLRDFGDDYPTRRNKEADLLEGWMNARK